MKLDKPEKIQLVYDSVGAFFCAVLLGVVCAIFVNPTIDPQSDHSFWQNFHFFLPFVFYSIYLFMFWRNSAFKIYRLNFLWILINLFSAVTTLLFSFFISDVVNKRILTEKSKFLPLNIFLSIVGGICAGLLFCAFWFWLFGLIHRILMEDRSQQSIFNLTTND